MRIGLFDVDSHNFPNLPLMKLSAWHKSRGDTVEWWDPDDGRYSIVYASKVFTESVLPAITNADTVHIGGSGIDLKNKLPYCPYVMIYDKQKFVDARGRLLPDVRDRYTPEQIFHFKLCQHLQRWTSNRALWASCQTVNDYRPYIQFLTKWPDILRRL